MIAEALPIEAAAFLARVLSELSTSGTSIPLVSAPEPSSAGTGFGSSAPTSESSTSAFPWGSSASSFSPSFSAFCFISSSVASSFVLAWRLRPPLFSIVSTLSAIESNQPATCPFRVRVDLSSALKKVSLVSRACLKPILFFESTSTLVVTGVETPSASTLFVVISRESGILEASS